MAGTTTEVAHLPGCDFCKATAQYDAKTSLGPWASLCRVHFAAFGTGLGIGKGQKLILVEARDYSRYQDEDPEEGL